MALILLPVASRVLGDASFGRYSLATTIMFFVMLVDDFGLNMWLTREIAKFGDRAQRYVAYTVGLKTTLILASLIFILILFAVTPYDKETVQAIWVFALYGILISFRDLAIAIFRAFEDMRWETVVLSVERVLITLVGIVVLLNGGGLLALAWTFVGAAVISLVLSASILFSRFIKPAIAFSLQEFWPILKGASVFGVSLFLTTIYSRIDMVMLSLMKGPSVWGWYSAAHKLIDFTNVIPTVFMVATFPTLSRLSVMGDLELSRLFTRGFKYLLLLAIPLVPGIILLSRPIITLVYGHEYLNAIPALRILSVTAALLFISIFSAGLYGATNNQLKLVLIQLFGLVLNAGLNYLLIPKLAHVGAAIATVVTESLVLTVTLIYIFRKITSLSEKRFIADAFAATAVMTTILYFFRNGPVFLAVSIAIVIYFSILLGLKTIRIQDLLSFKGGQEKSI